MFQDYEIPERKITQLYNRAAFLRHVYMENRNFEKLAVLEEVESLIKSLRKSMQPSSQLVSYMK